MRGLSIESHKANEGKICDVGGGVGGEGGRWGEQQLTLLTSLSYLFVLKSTS